MKSQITMKDIADHFGMSLNTIHKAIAGKPGVSDVTRKKILKYASDNGYQLNTMASILKRKQLTVAVCLPQVNENSKYFYGDIWDGCRAYLKEWSALNIQTEEFAFPDNSFSSAITSLVQKHASGNSIDGLLTIPPQDDAGINAIKKLSEQGTSIVFVTGDNSRCQRLGAVSADYHAAGQLMAEQICNLLPPESHVCLMTGDEYNDAHYTVAKGFHEYIRQNQIALTVDNLYGYYETDALDEKLLDILHNKQPDAVLSVFARGSAVLSKALKESHKAGKIPAIANDIFPENVDALKDGTFTNLVFKDPFRQAYLAMKMLCDYLVRETIPEESVHRVEARLIFRSNLKYYYPVS